MDRPKFLHDNQEWYVNFVTRSTNGHTQVVTRGMEAVNATHLRIGIPSHLHSEIRQHFENQFGPETEVLFI